MGHCRGAPWQAELQGTAATLRSHRTPRVDPGHMPAILGRDTAHSVGVHGEVRTFEAISGNTSARPRPRPGPRRVRPRAARPCALLPEHSPVRHPLLGPGRDHECRPGGGQERVRDPSGNLGECRDGGQLGLHQAHQLEHGASPAQRLRVLERRTRHDRDPRNAGLLLLVRGRDGRDLDHGAGRGPVPPSPLHPVDQRNPRWLRRRQPDQAYRLGTSEEIRVGNGPLTSTGGIGGSGSPTCNS